MALSSDESLDLDSSSDEQLAAEAAREASDGVVFEHLLSRYRERVWRVCYRLLGNEADAQDASQEVFLRMFTCRKQFAGRSKYSTWVHGIALRTSLHLRRGRSRRLKRVYATDQETLEQKQPLQDGTDSPELSLDLTQMLEILSEEDRAMLILKYAEQYSFEDLAEIFGLSQSACKMRVSRAREKLKQAFPESM